MADIAFVYRWGMGEKQHVDGGKCKPDLLSTFEGHAQWLTLHLVTIDCTIDLNRRSRWRKWRRGGQCVDGGTCRAQLPE